MVIWYSMYLSSGRENIDTKPYTSYRNIVFARINMRKMEEERWTSEKNRKVGIMEVA